MHILIDVDHIFLRARAIRLPQAHLAAAAGVDKSILVRARQRGTINSRNLRALTDVLVAEELRLRDYLLGVHPLPAAGGPPPSTGADLAGEACAPVASPAAPSEETRHERAELE